jgi:hypothetical protein
MLAWQKSRLLWLAIFLSLVLMTTAAWADITGKISGFVKDPSGAFLPGVQVTTTNTQTGIKSVSRTDDKGFYSFTALPVGTYVVEAQAQGFKKFQQTGLVVDANSALRVDVQLEVGKVIEEVTVSSDALHVETENTQMGEVINNQKITSVPLNGRSFTDLLSLQPGVVPGAYSVTGGGSGSGNGSGAGTGTVGLNDRSPSGGENAGNQSVNGQRETSNGFMVNGANVEEGKNNGAGIIPNLDSIDQFRIITNNFDAQYGNYSGGQINVVTKSGTNRYHGTVFEFLRNTNLDARNFFAPTVPTFQQNQFGGVFGGPIKHDKTFFFVDYQGTRTNQGFIQTVGAPSAADITGNLSDVVNPSTTNVVANAFGGSAGGPNGLNTVQGQAWADTLAARMGLSAGTFTAGTTPYVSPGCTSTAQCVFPGGVIPASAFSPVSVKMLQSGVIPAGDPATGLFTSQLDTRLQDDKGAARVDFNTRWGQLFAYYFIDDFTRNDPFPVASGGANVPGFNAISSGRAQMINLGSTKTFGANLVNDFRFSYVRLTNLLFHPQGGLGVTLSSLGFVPGFSTPGGIAPVAPQFEGFPNVTFANLGMTFGVPADTPNQFNNMYQWQDNVLKVIGVHTLSFGGQFHYDQINYRNLFGQNGVFTFDGTETGNDFADFLLGAPGGGGFIQASQQILDSRSKYFGVFVADSWRARTNLTLNYGLRYEISTPWYDTQNKIETIVPGQQSVVFPGAPTGLVFPGDKGIPPTLAPTQYNAFSPRLGVAYSPGATSGWFSKLTGGPGKTSIRAGFGVFFTAIEDLSQFQEVGDIPYGLFYTSAVPSSFAAPYQNRGDGTFVPQQFPFTPPSPLPVTPANPNTTFNWAPHLPITGNGDVSFFFKNRLPYAEHYEFSLQRQVGPQTLISASYVGTQAHRLPTFVESNPANAALCLSLNNVVSPASVGGTGGTCTPTFQDPGVGTPFVSATGQVIPTVRNPVLGPQFGNNAYEQTSANSNYNSLQLTLRHNAKMVELLAGYTYSKCMDNSSGLQERTSPFDPTFSRGLCIFDVTQNFVASYTAQLPFQKMGGNGTASRLLLDGWAVSGITTFATGLPITITENDNLSLTGAGIDVPNFTSGPILANSNPRNGPPFFNTGLFSSEVLGQLGNSRRRFFHGPGINNWDMALLKNFKFNESRELQLRAEAFNVFNHTQFNNPTGLFNSPNFGVVTSANAGRIMQLAAKIVF